MAAVGPRGVVGRAEAAREVAMEGVSVAVWEGSVGKEEEGKAEGRVGVREEAREEEGTAVEEEGKVAARSPRARRRGA